MPYYYLVFISVLFANIVEHLLATNSAVSLLRVMKFKCALVWKHITPSFSVCCVYAGQIFGEQILSMANP